MTDEDTTLRCIQLVTFEGLVDRRFRKSLGIIHPAVRSNVYIQETQLRINHGRVDLAKHLVVVEEEGTGVEWAADLHMLAFHSPATVVEMLPFLKLSHDLSPFSKRLWHLDFQEETFKYPVFLGFGSKSKRAPKTGLSGLQLRNRFQSFRRWHLTISSAFPLKLLQFCCESQRALCN